MTTPNPTHDSFDGLVSLFTNSLVASGRSNHTVRAYEADLRGYAQWAMLNGPYSKPIDLYCDVDSPWNITKYLNAFRLIWAPSTCKRKVAAFRAFVKYTGQPFPALDAYKAPTVPPGIAHPLPGGIPDIMKMVHATKTPRHRALVALIGLLGLRCSEARSTRAEDFSDDTGHIVLRVRGKGDKTRYIPVDDRVMELLDEPYRVAYEDAKAGGRGLLCPMTDRGARKAWTRLGQQAGLSRPTATHDGRMTFGTAAYDQDKDLRAVQTLLGHASTQTTETYTSVTMDKMRKAGAVL